MSQLVKIRVLCSPHEQRNCSTYFCCAGGLQDGTCIVALGTSGHGDVVMVTHSEIELVVPEKADRVKIVSGELRRSTGKLIGIDGGDGIVKMDTLDVKILDMSSLAKMVAN